MEVGMISPRGALANDHHERKQKSIQVVVLLAHGAEHVSKVVHFPLVHISEQSEMAAGINLNLSGKPSCEGNKSNEAVVRDNDALLIRELLRHERAIETRLMRSEVLGRRL